MLHLLSPRGEAALAAAMRQKPLLAFDFDGTLAPIVARPGEARVSVAVARRLADLARRCPVAIVTGRRADDVAHRLGFEPQYIIGNHGAEDPSVEGPAGAPAPGDDWSQALKSRLQAQAGALRAAGVEIEDKRLSIALHYRLAEDRNQALSLITSLVRGPGEATRVFGGKCVVNVAPAGAPDKADAVMALVERSGADSAVFVGDDINDEVVFQRAPPHWLTVRVGRDDRNTAARYFLEGPEEVGVMLHDMLACRPGR